MNRAQLNLQDLFLNQVRKENVGVTIYLTSGNHLRGTVRGFDAFTVLLDTVGKPTQLVYKHAIASVVPVRQLSSYQNTHTDGGQREQAPIRTVTETNASESLTER